VLYFQQRRYLAGPRTAEQIGKPGIHDLHHLGGVFKRPARLRIQVSI
jgi:hypothetical protein